jgi:hypothetical protein
MKTDIQVALREIADGIRSDIFKSYEAINLLQMVSANAPDINDSGFDIFFGRFQSILQEQITLLLSKIFEKPSPEFPLKSIPAAEKFITENRQAFIQIESNDETVLMLLRKLGYKMAKRGDTVTDVFCKYWQNHIGEMKSARQKIEMLRSKVSAHHENVSEKLLPDISLSETLELLERAKNFLAIIDSAYLGVVSVDYEGNYFANSESKTASLLLKNLLVKASIIDLRKGRESAKALYE